MDIKINNGEIILTDANIDNDNFLEFVLVGGEEITINIDELLTAVQAFHNKRDLNNKRDKSYG